ncbi:MAG TPA: type 2 isopentenyl-diphosphate Delta-isomerase [Bacilli bacterium]
MAGESEDLLKKRKAEHISIVLNEQVSGANITSGLERYRFWHNALPELDFTAIDTSTVFFGKKLRFPLLVSSMTGGAELSAEINKRLATTAERRGWAMGLGSMRAVLEHAELRHTYIVRRYAPSIPLFANLGAVQLNYGYGVDECRKAVEMIEADGLILHLNSLQEVFQPEGDTNFSGLLGKIEKVAHALAVPVGVKEVGWGISGAVARRLADAGVSFIDVAGAGGTSWALVEKYRAHDGLRREAADAFAGWGIPTAESLIEVRAAVPHIPVIASGGIASGVEAAKAIALGASLAGFGRSLLADAVSSAEALDERFARAEFELKAAMFGIGAGTIAELAETDALRKCT